MAELATVLTEEFELEEDTQSGKFLLFTLGKEGYGIEIKFVTEIIGIQEITEVPELPEYIKGVINLRGKIIPVMDVRLRFRKPAREYDDRTCIVVVDINEIPIGLVVDRVSEVTSIGEELISPPPNLDRGFQRYIKGVGRVDTAVILLLECNQLLEDDELQEIGRIQ